MQRFVDLHCHFVPGIDDGARTVEESAKILTLLSNVGFRRVIATPHMRPGLFDNDASAIQCAFTKVAETLRQIPGCPEIALSSEHYFDDVVYSRILSGKAVPYPGERAVLLEFYESDFPYSLAQRLADITRHGLTPVVAHPERYQPVAKDPAILERLLDVGAVALLDLAAVVGKYGRQAKRTAEELLERGYYLAACSDAHRPEDVAPVAQSIDWLRKRYGEEAITALLVEGPESILQGSA